MTIKDFLATFQDMLQRDEEVTIDMELHDMDEWDSMSIMACIAYFNMYLGIKVSYLTMDKQKTVRDIIALSNGKIA